MSLSSEKTVEYGKWKIAVDIEGTQAYYRQYKIEETQAHRNFAKYCETMPEEERKFFEGFGINPLCCEIESIGASKKGEFPCGGYYLICGKYIDFPKEQLISLEEAEENGFDFDRDDTRIDIGIFQFDFQNPLDEIFCDEPEDMPEGFICVRFWCEEMRWLLDEPCEEMMYEPPKFWQIGRILKERSAERKEDKANRLAIIKLAKETLASQRLNFTEMTDREVKEYKKEWLKAFAPDGSDMRKINKICLPTRRYGAYLWHIFSYEILASETPEKARQAFDAEKKDKCVLLFNIDDIGFRIENAGKLNSAFLEDYEDITVTAADFSWTYSKTHEEETCGPYFYKK